ncbi:hypothetical protein BTK96_000400 [Burkholderia pyrrocinia]|uniref:hypothetical protein n=1 Tax=Burkholderia sp. IT-111MI5 TaxID=3026439 RepID=UPI002A32EF29|nr:hypothetical protein [Burkholderia pyrrocinia]EKS9893201.1 hypothetical protein [Burkholderia pyrrocinia]EKS9909060.1 hypothetical protein [Burkholderia pyrrocinia]
MKYFSAANDVKVGDSVLVEDNVDGTVVCDFDHSQFLHGYEDWAPSLGVVTDGVPTKGFLIKTKKYGLINYEDEDESIKFIKSLDD